MPVKTGPNTNSSPDVSLNFLGLKGVLPLVASPASDSNLLITFILCIISLTPGTLLKGPRVGGEAENLLILFIIIILQIFWGHI